LVNGASVFILGFGDHEHHHNDHGHDHHHHDHNFRAAYFHVLADALTSLLAIGALLSAKYFGQIWLDPMMGIVGALLVGKWSVGLLRESGHVLLDRQALNGDLEAIRKSIEVEQRTLVVDLHVWLIGPGRKAAIISIEAAEPRPVDAYRAMLPSDLGLTHVTIEVSPSL
jgi:cation diffusion facilitator family transporter